MASALPCLDPISIGTFRVEGSRLVAEESVLEEGALSAPGGEVLDGLDLVHPLAGVAELGPSREVVAGRLVGPLDAEGELARLGRPLVGAGEVADEDFGEVQPTVDAVGLEAVEPCARRALQHEGDVLHGDAPIAVGYADGRGVVDEPIFRLHRAVVLGRVSGEREPFGEGLVADAGAKAWRADIVFFF